MADQTENNGPSGKETALAGVKTGLSIWGAWEDLQSKKARAREYRADAFVQEKESRKSADWTVTVAEEKARRLEREQQYRISEMWSSYSSYGFRSRTMEYFLQQQMDEAERERRFILMQGSEERERYLTSAELFKSRQAEANRMEEKAGTQFVIDSAVSIVEALASIALGGGSGGS